jgi:DNA-binding response OmpR family regulator
MSKMNHIFIVERDKVFANWLQNFFLSAGYIADDPGWPMSIILERMRTGNADLALIDATTLGKSLKWFIGELKTCHPDIVIIIMTTSLSWEQHELVASDPGVYNVIVKPFGFGEILMMAQMALEEKRGLKHVAIELPPPPSGKECRKGFRGKNGQPAGIEKRSYYRVRCELPLKYCAPACRSDSNVFSNESKTIDLSCAGVRFAVDQTVDFPSGRSVYLAISLPGYGLFQAAGELRWETGMEGDAGGQAGVQFSAIKDEERNRMARYVYP